MLNWFATNHCIGELNAAVSVGLRLRAFYVHREVCRPADGQVVSAESEDFVNIGVAHLYTSRNRARIGKLPFLQAKADAERDGCAPVMQPAMMCGKGVWR